MYCLILSKTGSVNVIKIAISYVLKKAGSFHFLLHINHIYI